MFNKVYITVIAVLLALSGTLGYFVYSGAVARGELKETNKVLADGAKRAAERAAQDRKVLVARQAEIASEARILQEQKSELLNALQRNKSWSDTDVPTEVQNALSGAPQASGRALGGAIPDVPDGL